MDHVREKSSSSIATNTNITTNTGGHERIIPITILATLHTKPFQQVTIKQEQGR